MGRLDGVCVAGPVLTAVVLTAVRRPSGRVPKNVARLDGRLDGPWLAVETVRVSRPENASWGL